MKIERPANITKTNMFASVTYMENAHTTVDGKRSREIFIKLCKTRTCHAKHGREWFQNIVGVIYYKVKISITVVSCTRPIAFS